MIVIILSEVSTCLFEIHILICHDARIRFIFIELRGGFSMEFKINMYQIKGLVFKDILLSLDLGVKLSDLVIKCLILV